MSELVGKIIRKDNLLWAWKKAKRAYQIGDIWFDEIEVIRFELNLNIELAKIAEEIRSGQFRINELKPLPFPKSFNNEEDKARTRQTFLFSVKDQVVWIAVVNIIGPDLDYKMPPWSYGNRLYINVWYEQELIKFGWYRNSHGNIYRKWNQSWPLYRRHVSLTSRIMSKSKEFNKDPKKAIESYVNDDAEKRAFVNNEATNNHLKVKYITKDYWNRSKNSDKLFWASIDLERFYPMTKISGVLANIKKYYLNNQSDVQFESLISELTNFKLDLTGWSPSEQEDIQITSKYFEGIPTGLFVAGFLANVALLDVDSEVTARLEKRKNVAHFRFVDDHVFVGYDFNELKNWIVEYEELLNSYNTGAIINVNKTEPREFGDYLACVRRNKIDEIDQRKKIAIKSTMLNPRFPSPLMTQTLAKVSAINGTEFDLLSENEEDQIISDLEHLLITDFPDHELRKDTRISFAATMLARLVPNRRKDYSKLYISRKSIYDLNFKFYNEFKSLDKNDSSLLKKEINRAIHSSSNPYKIERKLSSRKNETIKKICNEIITLKKSEEQIFKKIESDSKKLKKHIFELILKSAKENHQKVRLWVRLLEYCAQTGYAPLWSIINDIEDIHKKAVSSNLSNSFLYSLFLNVVSDRILIRTSQIINSKFVSEEDTNSYINFIDSVYDQKLLKQIIKKHEEEKKEYFSRSIEIFFTVIASLPETIERNNLGLDLKKIDNSLDLLNLRTYSIFKASNNNNDQNINNWLLWYFSKLQGANKAVINKSLFSILNLVDKNHPSCISVIKLAPDYDILSKVIDQNVLILAFENIKNEGWYFDLAFTMKNKDQKAKSLLQLIYLQHPKIREHLEYTDNISISVYDWLMSTNVPNDNDPDNKSLFDPSFSEWTSLQIIIQAIEQINNARTPSSPLKLLDFSLFSPVHPSNFLIPLEWTQKENKASWEKWRRNVDKNRIELRSADLAIIDNRYTPDSLVQYSAETISTVYGLGILLISLISKNVKLPWVWNSEEQNFALSNIHRTQLKDISASSYTFAIIDACLNNKDKETQLWIRKNINNVRGFEASDDTLKESPQIRTLEELKDYCIKASSILEKYQISVQNDLPRQLIPISLEQLSKVNNPFIEKSENLS